MRTHAPFSSPAPESPAKRPPSALSKRDAAHFSARNSSAPAPLERKRTQDLCVLTRRSAAPRRKPPRAAPSAHAVRRIFPRAIHRLLRGSKGHGHRTYAYSRAVQQPRAGTLRALPRRLMRCGWESPSMALTPRRRRAPMRRSKGGSRTLIRRFGSPRSTFHSALFDVYRIADLRAHFKASVSRPAKTASCRLKKTRRRARSVPRPRQCVLKGGSSAGPRAPLSPLHLPNVLDNAV